MTGITANLLLSVQITGFYQTRNTSSDIRFRTIVIAGIAIGLSEALSTINFPFPLGLSLFEQVGPALFAVQLVSSVLFGGLLKLQDDRVHALQEADSKAQALHEILKQSVGALSSAMEHRDPTTAGHEKRVADLAVAVGKELRFEPDQLEGLQFAALVHDVGQIQIPTEILTRPRRLNPEEFELIKTHCESGYEILRDIQFPWPITEIVYQHHENVDGSSYPRDLKGDDILLEARIITVRRHR